jgi:hypothetical protein
MHNFSASQMNQQSSQEKMANRTKYLKSHSVGEFLESIVQRFASKAEMKWNEIILPFEACGLFYYESLEVFQGQNYFSNCTRERGG